MRESQTSVTMFQIQYKTDVNGKQSKRMLRDNDGKKVSLFDTKTDAEAEAQRLDLTRYTVVPVRKKPLGL